MTNNNQNDFANKEYLLQVANRLRILIVSLDINQRKFCAETGINYDNLQKIISSGTDFGISNLYKICKRYPDINLNWLITGEGENCQQGNSVNISNCRNNKNIGNIHTTQANYIERLLEQSKMVLEQNKMLLEHNKMLLDQNNTFATLIANK